MIVDVSHPVFTVRGEKIPRASGTETVDTIGADLIIEGLQDRPGEELPAADKVRIVRLQQLVAEPGVKKVDLPSDDVTFIKTRCEKNLNSLGYVRVLAMLEEAEASVVTDEPDGGEPADVEDPEPDAT